MRGFIFHMINKITKSLIVLAVNAREQNQQDRIANGEKNDTLTPGQAAHLENREQKTENQEKADMAAHNGHLTKAEQKQLNKEQNKTSKQIYKDKHYGK